ncbi:hypothetical protein SHJG_7906 [Streptomyces hygroscopicus subsp. jinggangensis 5008]|nr:hypothetical protein SHJG_7906 [Streptomyces hygroscopicus subsp. jinggangensis 5008]AGF67330.1 hypothetical protein SHJGH_7668 [Streptomyces hygroscopicus subsp. jinggangensis TL01]
MTGHERSRAVYPLPPGARPAGAGEFGRSPRRQGLRHG